jgi:tetratricopeptide (TPR) repeat protein
MTANGNGTERTAMMTMMKRILQGIGLLLWLWAGAMLFAAPVWSQSPPLGETKPPAIPASVASVIAEAEKLQKEGKFTEAIALLEKRIAGIASKESEVEVQKERTALLDTLIRIKFIFGHALYRASLMHEALSEWNQVVNLCKETQNRRIEGMALNNIGNTYRSLSQFTNALDYYQQAVLLHRIVQNKNAEAGTSMNIGDTYDALSRFDEALHYYEKSLSLYKKDNKKD